MTDFYEPLAIIGAYCCVPGAFSPDEFWENLSQGKVSIGHIPNARYPFDIYKSETNGVWGKSHTNLVGIVDFKEFNERIKPAFIEELISGGINPDDNPAGTVSMFAAYTAYKTIKNSGYDPFKMPSIPYGVFTGTVRLSEGYMYNQISKLIPWLKELFQESFPELSEKTVNTVWDDFEGYWSNATNNLSPYFSTAEKGMPHHISRYIQRLFHLHGHGFTFDSACSTSLAVFYFAKHYLALHPDGMVLCGGLTQASKNNINLFSYNKANSGDGSFPFDERADGLVQGEGCSYLLVRPLPAALKAKDQILGIVRGVGVTCDGKGKGLWAPNVKGQHLAISRAWDDAHLDSSYSPDYIEAHATSTRLGDATELESIEQFLNEKNFNNKIPITSVKANIGHLLEASGATSAIKVLQSLKHQVILPQASFKNPTSKFDWDSSLLHVQTEVTSWPVVKGKKRLAIVNAFGIGGLNASAVFEGPETAEQTYGETERSPISPKAIAIVGIGCVAPNAFDTKEFRKRVKQGESVKTFIPEKRNDLLLTHAEYQELNKRGVKAGFINDYNYDWKRHNIPPKQIQEGHVLQYWHLGAVDQAIDDAGMPQNVKQADAQPELWDRTRTAIISGSKSNTDYLQSIIPIHYLSDIQYSIRSSLTKMGFEPTALEDVTNAYKNKMMSTFPHHNDQSGGFSISTLSSRISKVYDIHGPSISLDGGYSASFCALAIAYNILQDSRVERALCVSGERAQGKVLHEILFKKDASITPPAEGSVAFVLKRAEDALANGDKIYAIIPQIEVNSSDIHIQDSHDHTTQTTMQLSDSLDVQDIEESIRKVFGDFGSAQGMMALANVLLDIQEKNQTVPASWHINQKDCEGIAFSIDIQNVAAYKQNGAKRVERPEFSSSSVVPLTARSLILASNYSISICRQTGTPYQMGYQYGKQYSQELRAMIRRYVDAVGLAAKKLLPLVPAMDKESLITRFGEDGLEEMRGMADGAGIPLEVIVRHNVCLIPTQDATEQKKLYNAVKTVHTSSVKTNS